MSDEMLLIGVAVGAMTGMLSGRLFKGHGGGLTTDNVVIGIIGAFLPGGALIHLGVPISSGMIGSVGIATLGAVALLAVATKIRAEISLGRKPIGASPISRIA